MSEEQRPPSEYEIKIDQADGIITKAWNLLKKHWGKLLVFLLIYATYKFVMLVKDEYNKQDTQEQVVQKPIEEQNTQEQTIEEQEIFLVREYESEQTDGSIAIIQVWSDSTESIK